MDISLRYPRPVSGCSCAICTRAGVSEDELKRLDNIPSPFVEMKLMKLSPYMPILPGADPKISNRIIKIEVDPTDSEFLSIEESSPQYALWAHSPQNSLWVRSCQKLLKIISKQKISISFSTPVDPIALNIPDYTNIIKHPMDFSTIENKLNSNPLGYSSPDEFIDDVRFVFRNCHLYNKDDHPITADAKTLSKEFEEALLQL